MTDWFFENFQWVFHYAQNFEIKILNIIWLFLPAAFANMAPVFAKFIFPNWDAPIDFGLSLNGKRIFGDHKTYRGFSSAVLTGLFVFFLQQVLHWKIPWLRFLKIIDYDLTSPFFGAWLGFCAITGDLIKSFFKRRIQIPPGAPWIPFDEIDWILGSLLGLAVIKIPSLGFILATIAIFASLDLLANWLGYKFGLKESPF